MLSEIFNGKNWPQLGHELMGVLIGVILFESESNSFLDEVLKNSVKSIQERYLSLLSSIFVAEGLIMSGKTKETLLDQLSDDTLKNMFSADGIQKFLENTP